MMRLSPLLAVLLLLAFSPTPAGAFWSWWKAVEETPESKPTEPPVPEKKTEAHQRKMTEAHVHARDANFEELRRVVELNKELVNIQDENGWTPLHEAVRAKDAEAVSFLLEKGADVNIRTFHKSGLGHSALYLALRNLDKDDPITTLLIDYGAKNYEPLKEEEVPFQVEQEL